MAAAVRPGRTGERVLVDLMENVGGSDQQLEVALYDSARERLSIPVRCDRRRIPDHDFNTRTRRVGSSN